MMENYDEHSNNQLYNNFLNLDSYDSIQYPLTLQLKISTTALATQHEQYCDISVCDHRGITIL